MRQERTVQASIFDLFADHEIGRELKAMSQWLDEHRELIGLAAEDLRRHGVKETGRWGLPAESVLRCALLKQHRQLSYEELAFHLEDSASFRAFARLPLRASYRFLEFFTAQVRNPHTRRAYARAATEFFDWLEAKGVTQLAAIESVHVATYIEELSRARSAPTAKLRLAALRHLFDWMVVGQIMPTNPA